MSIFTQGRLDLKFHNLYTSDLNINLCHVLTTPHRTYAVAFGKEIVASTSHLNAQSGNIGPNIEATGAMMASNQRHCEVAGSSLATRDGGGTAQNGTFPSFFCTRNVLERASGWEIN